MTVPVIESNTSNSGISGATLSCTAPAGIMSGDLLVLICCNDDKTDTPQFTDNKSGWEFLGQEGSALYDAHIGVFYKIATGSETSESVTATTVNDWVMFYIRISGVDAATPWNTAMNTGGDSASSIAIAGVTTDEDDCLVLYGLSFDGGDGFPFSVSGTGWSEGDEGQSSGDGDASSGCWGSRDLVSQGGSGTATVTAQITDGSSFFQAAINADLGVGSTLLPIYCNQKRRVSHTNIRR